MLFTRIDIHRMKIFAIGACLALPLLLLPAVGVHAVVPANSLIRNTATLTGDGLPAGGVSAFVDVRIDLVPAAPILSKTTILTQMPDDNAVAENQSSTVVYRVTNNANGPDTYLITSESFAAVNLSGHSGSAIYSQTAIALGATAAISAAGAGALNITVPYDGASDGSVNGIAAGDRVRIGDQDYEIVSTSENPGGQTATFVLSTPLPGGIEAGEPIRGYGLFTLTIGSVGSMLVPGTPAYIDASTRATSQAGTSRGLNLFDADSATDSAANGSNGHRSTIISTTFGKFVRNLSKPNGDAQYAVTYNGQSYYPSAGKVLAAPGETVEYALVIGTSAAGLPASPVTDTVPAYTTYQPGSFTVNGVPVSDDGILPLLGGYNLGTVQGAQTIVITFQVKVNNN